MPGTVAFAAIAVAANLVSSRVLESAQASLRGDPDLNITSAKTHVLGDALASLAVIAGWGRCRPDGAHLSRPARGRPDRHHGNQERSRHNPAGGRVTILERSPFRDMAGLQKRLGELQRRVRRPRSSHLEDMLPHHDREHARLPRPGRPERPGSRPSRTGG